MTQFESIKQSWPTATRRRFLTKALMASSCVVVTVATVPGCGDGESGDNVRPSGPGGRFFHGVASGDPKDDAVIIWTRITPEIGVDLNEFSVEVGWQIALEPEFQTLMAEGKVSTDSDRDFTVKLDVQDLLPGQVYYYRFLSSSEQSAVGRTKTLPQGSIDEIKFAVVSCSNYPAGYFHVYGEVAKKQDLDAVLHLGDYLYEYERNGYASEDAAALGREVIPAGEIVSLDDYRQRYAQYRTDENLQAAHASAPFICVWDDHEVTNDAWREGAENHDDATEGDFGERVMAALKAYAEWLPIRPPVDKDVSSLYRSFVYGDLLNLSMLDTRLVGRDRQLSFANYTAEDGSFDAVAYSAELSNPSRTLLGTDQREWLLQQFAVPTQWHVLGQQVLMGRMELPAAIATQQLTINGYAELAQIAATAQTSPELLTAEQLANLQQNGPLLSLPSLPYNLDAWDGYPTERQIILSAAEAADVNLVVLAGDTHNAWANNLSLGDSSVGVEFATSSVTSPGAEDFLGLSTPEAVAQTEVGLVQLIAGLKYTNLSDRGFLLLTLDREQVTAEYQFIDSIKSPEYGVLEDRSMTILVKSGVNSLN